MNQDRPARILLVEDEAMNRALFRAVLARAPESHFRDAMVLEAGAIEEARTILAQETVDMIFLDVRLPDGSGLDLARELAARPKDGAEPRVAILSASVLPSERAAALAAGASAFLAKPYRPAELLELLSAFSEGRTPEL